MGARIWVSMLVGVYTSMKIVLDTSPSMFNSNTYTNFRTACKYVLILSYVLQVI